MKNKVVILAAGSGTRMKSNKNKMLHKIFDKAIVEYSVCAAQNAGIKDICLVINKGGGEIKKFFENKEITFAVQGDGKKGTGYAAMCADGFYSDADNVVIICGDTPLLTSSTVKRLFKRHIDEKNDVTFISAIVPDPFGLGRIVRDEDGEFVEIVEHNDANEAQLCVNEINTGVYCFKASALKASLSKIKNKNKQGEYYLTDTLSVLLNDNKKVGGFLIDDYKESLGVNSRKQLVELTKILKNRVNEFHLENGVTIVDPDSTYIGIDVVIGEDTTVHPNTHIYGKTEIGENCEIGPNTSITSSQIADGVTILSSTILESTVGCGTKIGPYAFIRPNSKIGNNVKIGDFVEIKNSTIGENTKVSHLTYIGDADIGKRINFGCGTVIVNYDGTKKHRTVVEDDSFIGCNTNLVAPVVVRKGGYTAAGSTITEDVPENSLAIARQRQINKISWRKEC